MASKDQDSVILATDLDGTFLGGSEGQRRELYQYIQTHRDRLQLVFVTGRTLAAVKALFEEPDFPRPDYIIADVGTTVFDGTLTPVIEIQEWIATKWGNAGAQVRELLAGEPGLEPQAIEPQYRVSYYYRPDELRSATLEKIDRAGFESIRSADRFLDVVPRGIAKGPTLMKLLSMYQRAEDRAIAAGDTLNDGSLFETGLKSIAVGNSEPKLVEKIQTMKNVYHSPHPGAAGIWDGLKHYGAVF
ncbi:MAG: HAD-IIB family hydrolase [Limnospira sp.]